MSKPVTEYIVRTRRGQFVGNERPMTAAAALAFLGLTRLDIIAAYADCAAQSHDQERAALWKSILAALPKEDA